MPKPSRLQNIAIKSNSIKNLAEETQQNHDRINEKITEETQKLQRDAMTLSRELTKENCLDNDVQERYNKILEEAQSIKDKYSDECNNAARSLEGLRVPLEELDKNVKKVIDYYKGDVPRTGLEHRINSMGLDKLTSKMETLKTSRNKD